MDKTTDRVVKIVALPEARQAIIDPGGLIPFTRQLLSQQAREVI